MLKVNVGSKEILYSGSALVVLPETIEVEFIESPIPMKIRFSFRNESADLKPQLNISVQENTADVVLINFNNSLGDSTVAPIEMGTYKQRKLYLAFAVYSQGNGNSKLFHQIWYLGDRVPENGGGEIVGQP